MARRPEACAVEPAGWTAQFEGLVAARLRDRSELPTPYVEGLHVEGLLTPNTDAEHS